MTYVIAKTQYLGRKWTKTMLSANEQFKVLSTSNQIRGRRFFFHRDCLYILPGVTEEVIQTLIPALTGCRVFGQSKV